MVLLRLFALILVIVISDTAPSRAGEHAFGYSVYISGFHVLDNHSTIAIDPEKDAYQAEFKADSVGLLKTFADWNGIYGVKGQEKDGLLLPTLYHQEQGNHEDISRRRMVYDENGHFKALEVNENDAPYRKDDIDVAMAVGTSDMMTTLIRLFNYDVGTGGCNHRYPVFDGRRRYDIALYDAGTETLKATSYNQYQGEAKVCTIEVIPVGDNWPRKKRGWLAIQEQGRKKNFLPHLWFMEMNAGTDHAIWLPVRVQVKTRYGSALMHLKDYSYNP